MSTLSIRLAVAKFGSLVHSLEKISLAAERLRKGQGIERFVAWAFAAGAVADLILPYEYPHTMLSDMGYTISENATSRYLCEFLRDNWRGKSTRLKVESMHVIFFGDARNGRAPIAAIYDGKSCVRGPYTLEGVDYGEAVRPYVWKNRSSLMYVEAKTGGNTVPGGKSYGLVPMPPLGSYVGDPTPEWFAERFSRYNRSRSILFAGPTGAGKTTLARHIARLLDGDKARVLKVPGSLVSSFQVEDAVELVRVLRPTVLLLDDVPVNSQSALDGLLTLYENVHDCTPLIISTYMDDDPERDVTSDGSLYWSGMRPGRIDEVFWIGRPGQQSRVDILRHYLTVPTDDLEAIAQACDGLTGAYLGEVVHRLNRFGAVNWRGEVAAVRRSAPLKKQKPVEPSEEDEEDEDAA